MMLGELRLGDVFRTPDGRVGVRWRWEAGNRQDRRLGCLWLDGHGFNTTLPVATPVERLDLPALLEEHALFRRLLEDAGQDQGYSVGVWAEREAVGWMLLERSEEYAAQIASLENSSDPEDRLELVRLQTRRGALRVAACDILNRGVLPQNEVTEALTRKGAWDAALAAK